MALIDVNLLRIAKHKSEYLKIFPHVPQSSLDPTTYTFLAAFGKYFKKFPKADKVDMTTFASRFRHWYPQVTDEQFVLYRQIMKNLQKDVDDDTKDGIISSLHEIGMATRIANMIEAYNDGVLKEDLFDVLQQEVDTYRLHSGGHNFELINENFIDAALEEDLDTSGYKWRLPCLHNYMRGLRFGDSGIIAACPDQGKTSFVASEITYLAPQLPEDKTVLWLNNEGPSLRIIPRLLRAALGMTGSELMKLKESGKLRTKYLDAIGGEGKINLVNIHNRNTGDIRRILDNVNAGIVVSDMLDNIKGFANDARNDLALEAKYQWMRDMGVEYEFVSLATSQISAEGRTLAFPEGYLLKDSRTGKQGACDFQIMIGSQEKAGFESIRHIGLPKNKLKLEGMPTNPKATVEFDIDRCIFKEIDGADYVPDDEPEEEQEE
jgi:replicative DNA helicase